MGKVRETHCRKITRAHPSVPSPETERDFMEAFLDYGYWGLFIGTFLAATVIPLASDVLLVGVLAMGGEPVTTIAVATLGNWLGGLTTYWVGYAGRWEWIERWFGVKRETMERHRERVAKWGPLMALLTWVPVIGDVIAIALGFYRVNFWRMSLFMLIGKCGRFVLWAVIYGGIFG